MNKKSQLIYPDNAIIMAPLSGFTDIAYRRAMYRQGCKFAFCEMVDVSSLAYCKEKVHPMLVRGEDETFLGCQLVGSDIEHTKIAIDKLNDYEFDVLDLNLGCPVPKVTKKCAGAELGRNIERALQVFALFGERSKFPISAKIRIISKEDVQPTLDLVVGLIELGAQAITIHGRVKEAYYSGDVAFEQIRACVELANNRTQIIANGGINSYSAYQEIKNKTLTNLVMVARGAMGNPYLFSELQNPESYISPTVDKLISDITLHMNQLIELYGEEAGFKISRKILHDYLKGRGFKSSCRQLASQVANQQDFQHFLDYIRVNNIFIDDTIVVSSEKISRG